MDVVIYEYDNTHSNIFRINNSRFSVNPVAHFDRTKTVDPDQQAYQLPLIFTVLLHVT